MTSQTSIWTASYHFKVHGVSQKKQIQVSTQLWLWLVSLWLVIHFVTQINIPYSQFIVFQAWLPLKTFKLNLHSWVTAVKFETAHCLLDLNNHQNDIQYWIYSIHLGPGLMILPVTWIYPFHPPFSSGFLYLVVWVCYFSLVYLKTIKKFPVVRDISE